MLGLHAHQFVWATSIVVLKWQQIWMIQQCVRTVPMGVLAADAKPSQNPELPPSYSSIVPPATGANSMSMPAQSASNNVNNQAAGVQQPAARYCPGADAVDASGRVPGQPGGGFIDHADKQARIACPIAGHPNWDKGAYYHPAGCCCYVSERTQGFDPCSFCCAPLTIGCWLGTLCYQPCGCICAKQFPYYGDCPFSWQRVTSSFPKQQSVKTTARMVLVPKNHRSRIILEHAADCRAGEQVPMTLSSHPGRAICKLHTDVKYYGEYSYIESTLGEAANAVRIKYDGNFIWVEGDDLVFDVSFWQYKRGQTVNFVGAGPQGPAVKGGGRDWLVNADGTISLKKHPNWVLGL